MAVSLIGTMDNTLFLAVGAISLVLLAIAALRRSQLHRATAREVSRDQRAQVREEQEVQHSMDDLLTQLEEISRRIDSKVDNGLTRLEAAIRAADARIARLNATTPASGELAQPAVPVNAPDAPPTAPRATPEQRRQRVYELADAGSSPLTIADKLHIPLGEVELILNLRKFA